MSKRTGPLCAAALLALTMCFGAGCGKDDSQQRAAEASNTDAQIKAIESNPNMPAQAKAMAIQQLRSRSGKVTTNPNAGK